MKIPRVTSVSESVLVILAVMGTVTATYLALGIAAALYLASAWALLIAYAIAVSRNP